MEAFEPLRDDTPKLGVPQLHRSRPTDLEEVGAEELIRWTLERFEDRAAVVTSFQAGGMVILDLAHRIRSDVRVITLDTGRLPAETYEVMEAVRERYGIDVEMYAPDARQVEELVRSKGPNLFYDSPADRKACCRVRKVEVLKRALAGVDAWMTGLRRDQSPERADTPKVTQDDRHGGILKIAPLATWTGKRVWSYIREHEVPYHPLYDQGYTSIGCAPCTRAPRPGEDARAGRWWWEDDGKKECGLHLVQGSEGPKLVRIGRGGVA